MANDHDRHPLSDAAHAPPHGLHRRLRSAPDEDEAELRALLNPHLGERAARYVPLPRLIQE